MPNSTTNHAITYTNYSPEGKHKALLLNKVEQMYLCSVLHNSSQPVNKNVQVLWIRLNCVAPSSG